MRVRGWSIVVFPIIGMLIVVYLWFSGNKEQNQNKSGVQGQLEKTEVLVVKTVPIRKRVISGNITVYGSVIPAPGAIQTISVPFESRVHHIMVSNGQNISAGETLLEIAPSPDTYLKFEQARNIYDMTEENFNHVQQMFDLMLATNTQLLQAKQALEQARLELESLKNRGIGDNQVIHAKVTGLIRKVYMQEGACVPAGDPLVDIIAQNRLEVNLGVEAEDMGKVKSDQTVLLSHVNMPESSLVTGRVRKISHSVNPTTRLVDVFITLPSSATFLLGESVLGKITIASSEGLIVPRSAVLPEGSTYVMFTVKNFRAIRHIVQMGLEEKSEVEVIGSDLHPGDQVVSLGNYELQDGMMVQAETSQ